MQPIFQTIVEYWHCLGEFFAFDAALLAEPSIVVRLVLLGVLLFCSAFSQVLRPRFSRSRGLISSNCGVSAIRSRRLCTPFWISLVD